MTDSKILFWSTGPEEYRYLSNFYASQFIVNEVIYKTSEHFYQAGKANYVGDFELATQIVRSNSPVTAKKLDSSITGHEEVRISIMNNALREKFGQSTSLRALLKKTGVLELIHFAPWGDTFWGVGKDLSGENNQGKLIMQIRSELK